MRFFPLVLKNVFRKKTRSFLTIVSILMPLFVICIMGTMLETLEADASGGRGMYRLVVRHKVSLSNWLPESYEWIDVDGHPFDLQAESDLEGRTTTYVEHEGEVVAALVHDTTLRDQAMDFGCVAYLYKSRLREQLIGAVVRATAPPMYGKK